jgi:DNA modification methylase
MKPAEVFDRNNIRALLRSRGLEDRDELVESLFISLCEVVNSEIARERNRLRIKKSDTSKNHMPARKVLTESEIAKLPTWLRAEIDQSVVIGKSEQVVLSPDGRKYHLANSLNHLSGAEWTYFLSSVVGTRYPTSGPESYAHNIRKIHPSPKPPQLMRAIIEFFTKEGDLVLDYFMGVGGTLLGASLAGRRAVGIELSSEYIDAYLRATNELQLVPQRTLCGDAFRVLSDKFQMAELLCEGKVALVAIDPPYGDMMNRPKTGEAVKMGSDTSPTPFTSLAEDLGNLSIEDFYPRFVQSIKLVMPYLRVKGHIAVFIKDLQPTGSSSNLLHARVIEDLNAIDGLRYLGTKIWADQSVNLYPYGYPYAFVSNQIHQYILFFRKEGKV